jgi:F-type H+-transporting ATPase subunit delta
MSAASVRATAKQLVQLSLENGRVSPERVTGVLEYLEKHRPSGLPAILRLYHRLIGVEIARGEARVEHAGPVSSAQLAAIAANFTRRYGRPVTSVARPNPALLAGLRVRIGDDLYESSVAGQLAALGASS